MKSRDIIVRAMNLRGHRLKFVKHLEGMEDRMGSVSEHLENIINRTNSVTETATKQIEKSLEHLRKATCAMEEISSHLRKIAKNAYKTQYHANKHI